MAMNPKSPKALPSLNHSPYPLQEDSEGYTFLTDRRTTYRLAFRLDADYFPKYDFAKSLFSFSLIPIDGSVLDKDLRIESTVAYVLNQTFDSVPEAIIAFTCSTEGDLERQRRILFGRWFQHNNAGYTRLTHTEKESRLYTAAIFRQDHPDRAEIERVFFDTYLYNK